MQRKSFQRASRNTDSLLLIVLAILAGSIDPSTAAADDAARLERGKQIWLSTCASCHGQSGEGTEDAYSDPLIGDLSIGQLTEVISETMPEGEPEVCVGEEAQAVADYMHYAFYSEAAQIRNRPPRAMLARLTADQLRQSLADLYAHFVGLHRPDEDQQLGLSGEYYAGTRRKKDDRKIERIDPVLDFDFGRESPGEGMTADEFLIYWRGGIRVDVSGRYEIIVRSTCSFVCNLGNYDREFIDNHVQSGDKTEFRRTLYLMAGRVYPFDLQMIQRNRKTEKPPANISLAWIPPGGVEAIIPTRNLVSGWVPATFSLQTPLPPDDRSYGYERGIAVNKEWDESTTNAALEFGQIAVDELWPRYREKHKDTPEEERQRLKAFLSELVHTAFRGELDEESRQLYIDRQVEQEADDAEAIKRVVLIALKSPRFLYPSLSSGSRSQQAGKQLALILYDSLPADEHLLKLMSGGELETEEEIRNFATHHLNDYRVRAKTRDMLHAWLNMEYFGDIVKDNELFAGFDRTLVAELHSSLNAFLDEVVWDESSDYRQFFKADWAFGSERIAEYYGPAWKPAEEGVGVRKTATSPELGHGLLTHPYLLSGLAYHDSTSPIHRGVFLIRYMLGRTLRPPADAFSPLSPDLHPDLTTRERVELQTSPESCQVCHARINGLGFALENYDAVGRFRTQENGKAIDVKGMYIARDSQEITFDGAAELAEYLTNSPDAHRAFVARAFQHFVKQPPAAYGADTLDRLTADFAANNFDIRRLLVEIAVVAAQPEIHLGATEPTEGAFD